MEFSGRVPLTRRLNLTPHRGLTPISFLFFTFRLVSIDVLRWTVEALGALCPSPPSFLEFWGRPIWAILFGSYGPQSSLQLSFQIGRHNHQCQTWLIFYCSIFYRTWLHSVKPQNVIANGIAQKFWKPGRDDNYVKKIYVPSQTNTTTTYSLFFYRRRHEGHG